MKCFITGITGFIGSNLASRLIREGNEVRAILRNPDRPGLVRLPGVRYFDSDLFDTKTLREAMRGTEVVFHLAACAKPWSKDPDEYRRINVEGSENVFSAAMESGVRKVVFTSSAATMSPSRKGTLVTENTPRTTPYYNAYESTKAAAEARAKSFCGNGLDVVIVNPSRVFGPGPINASNAVTKMILMYAAGTWRIIPGNGRTTGNYVFIDDVVDGHLQAAKMGKGGERYILGGENLTFDQFFAELAAACNRRQRMVHIPLPLLSAAARLMEGQARITGIPPLITASFVRKYLDNWSLSTAKSEHELGYRVTPFREGVRMTLDWHHKGHGHQQ